MLKFWLPKHDRVGLFYARRRHSTDGHVQLRVPGAMISNVLKRFERGVLTCWELVQALTMLAATSGVTCTARAQEAGFQGLRSTT